MEGIADVDNQSAFLRDEIKLGLDIAVDTLARLTADSDDSGIGGVHFLVDGNRRDANLRIFLLTHHLCLEPLCRMTLGLEFHTGIVDVLTIDIGKGLARLDTSILQTFKHVNHVGGMNTARAYAAGKEVVAVFTKQSHRLDIFPRQGAVVLQQHDTFGGTLTGDGGMGLEVGRVRGGILLEARRLDDVLQHAAHVAVDVGHVELATLHTLNNLLDLCRLSGLHQVVAGLYLGNGLQSLANANPVGHHNTLIAPVVAQDAGQQVAVAHRVLAVHLVIRRHDGPRVALADGNLEAAQIEFAGCTLAQTLVDGGAVSLLRVDGKVLGRDASTLVLNAVDVGGSNLTRQQRVF